MPVCLAALMCHAPIVVPAVGGVRGRAGWRTTRAMAEVGERAARCGADRVIVVSPHTPRHRGRWAARRGRVVGDLGRFGARGAGVDLPGDEIADRLGLAVAHDEGVDHGALVPLWFLADAGWAGPTTVIALPGGDVDAVAFGARLAELPGRTCLIASGDMSHRLIPGAPSGFDARAQAFDDAFVAALRADDWAAARAAEPRELAAEDVIDSFGVAVGAVGAPTHAEVLHYEGPWGVGYCEALLHDPEPPPWALARQALTAAVLHRPFQPPPGPPAAGVFVTLRKDGRLRGCIGRITDLPDLHAGLGASARSAGLDDPRFPPVQADELPDLSYEVSVLQAPEPARPDQLDPAVYGVIVSAGLRRGVLLPAVETVDTVADQLAIARRKGGIGEHEEVQLQRFVVAKHASPLGPGEAS